MLGLKQSSGDNKCVAVCAAMAFDSTVEAFQILTNGEPPYSEFDFAKYAFREGYLCGIGIDESEFCSKINVSDSENEDEFLFTQNEITPETKLKIEFKVKDFPALIIVQAETGEGEHAIYWDTKQVWDPNPMMPNGLNLNRYKILRYFPIIKMED